jgi:hypothetical protein
MNTLPSNEKILRKFGPYTLVTGVLLTILGIVGIVQPLFCQFPRRRT